MALVRDPNTGQIYDDTRGIMIPDFLSRLENLPMPPMPTLNMQPPENLLNVTNEPQPFIDPKMTMRPEDARTISEMQYIAAQNPEIPNRFPMKDAPVRTVPQTQTIQGPGNNLQATARVPSVSKARADELRQQYGVDPRPDPLADYKAVMNREPGFFQENAPLILGLLGGVSGLLEAMGPSRTPVSSGQVFARGLQSGLGGYMGGLKYQQQAKESQQEEARNLLDEVTFRQSFENAELKKQQSANLKTAIREGLRDLQGVNLSSEMQRQVRLAESLLNAGAIGSAYQVFSKIAPTPAAQPSTQVLGPNDRLFGISPDKSQVTELVSPLAQNNQTGPLFMTGQEIVNKMPNLQNSVDANQNYRVIYDDQGRMSDFQLFDLTPEEKKLSNDPGTILTGDELNKAQGGRQIYVPSQFYIADQDGVFGLANKDSFGQENKLRGEFNKKADRYTKAKDSYNNILSAFKQSTQDPNRKGVSDLQIVRSFMLMIEPESVVRESEFASAAAAQGILEKLLTVREKVEAGAILSDTGRRNFVNAARAYISQAKESFAPNINRYSDIAREWNLNPENVVFDPFEGLEGLKEPQTYEWSLFDETALENTGAGTQTGNPTDLKFGRAK